MTQQKSPTEVAEKNEAGPPKESVAESLGKIVERLKAITAHPTFRAYWLPVAVVLAAIGFAYWPLVGSLPGFWMQADGYYSHGFLIPFISAYIVYTSWDAIKGRPVKPAWLAGLLFVPVMLAGWAANTARVDTFWALSFIGALLVAVWFVAGFRWLRALFFPVAYLGFAMPIGQGFIDQYTNPLQILSTKVAYHLVQLYGFNAFAEAPTVVQMDHFTLDVAVPCSGLKLVFAVTAFSVFFVLIAKLRWWANLVMLGMILPLCVLINGLRISLIGVVGETCGKDAGLAFHDYSGYITLIVCFFLLFKLARLLGWKD